MIQVIHRAFDILEYIASKKEEPQSLGDIADHFKLNHATCANIIKTMVNRRYLSQIGPKKGYVLGAKSYELSGGTYKKDLLEAAKADMEDLTATLNENAVLAVLNGNMRIIVYSTFSQQDLQVRTSKEKDVFDSASGRLLFSMMSDAEISRFLVKYGYPSETVWKEASTETSLFDTVKQIREEQLAIQLTQNKQIIGLAVPVYVDKKVVASLSIYMPEYRYMLVDKTKVATLLRDTANRISKKFS